MHDVAEPHDTAANGTPSLPGLGVTCTAHLLPFHRSATGPAPVLGTYSEPTAVQARAEVHDTPVRKLFVAPGGRTRRITDHLWPFQRSASIVSVPFRVTSPTATHITAAGQDTARKVSARLTAASGRAGDTRAADAAGGSVNRAPAASSAAAQAARLVRRSDRRAVSQGPGRCLALGHAHLIRSLSR